MASSSASRHFSMVATCVIITIAAKRDCSGISQARVQRIITRASASTLRTLGSRAPQAFRPKTFMVPTMHHWTSGGLRRNGLPPTEGTIQLPPSIIVTAGMIRLPSSPFNSVDPRPGRKIAAQRAVAISSAVSRFTGRFCTAALVVGKHFFFLAAGCVAVCRAEELPKPTCEHVLLVIWDGMRPDFIREDLTPNAWSLVKRGTFFAKNHATYISTTEVNGSSIATGMKPRNHGIFANNEYRPEVNLIATVATQGAWPIRVGDILSGRQWLTAPT